MGDILHAMRVDEKRVKMPPFKLAQNSTASLSDQMTDGFRQAILGGYYREGDVLPPIRKLEKFFGVSLFVPREVLSRLTREGLVNPRPHIGSVVMARNSKVRLGRILLVIPDVPGAYYANAFGDVLREGLASAGYAFTRLTVLRNPNGSYDMSGLDIELNQNIDLTILLFDAPDIAKRLSRAGKPFVAIGQDLCKSKSCVGNVYRPRNGAAPEFIRHCLNAGVRTVLLADLNGEGFSILDGIDTHGVKVEKMLVPAACGGVRPGDIQQSSFETFAKLFGDRSHLPDLLLLADENVIVGALMAALATRIQVPEQLKLVVWSHVGGGPVFPISVTRMEMDPYVHGRLVADAVIRKLRGGVFPPEIVLKPIYKVCDSFR